MFGVFSFSSPRARSSPHVPTGSQLGGAAEEHSLRRRVLDLDRVFPKVVVLGHLTFVDRDIVALAFANVQLTWAPVSIIHG